MPTKKDPEAEVTLEPPSQMENSPPLLPDIGRPHIIIRSSSNGDDDGGWNVLYEIMPDWIILYSPDITLVRRIEVFKALYPSKKIKVYFLVYDNSVEEQQYLTTLAKEKAAFQQLIEKKGSISIPIDEHGNVVIDMAQKFWSMVDSRNAGGQMLKRKILVDVREFRSALPMSIFSRGCDVVPCTLEVGDYILSPRVAVERKSPSDLAGSLKSGRLFNQTTAMRNFYTKTVLLIEFPQPNSFKLTFSPYEKELDVPKRLVLFCLHFPDVALLWTCSPAASAEIFDDIQVPSANLAI